MYLQNAGASMIVKNNVSIASLNNCMQVYGSNASLRNVTFDGNIMLNCDVVIGGGTPASGMKFINNIMGENSAARFYFANQSNEDLVVTGNHFLESSQVFWWKSLAITGNYFYKGFEIRTQAGGDISGYQAEGNTYYLSPILKVGSATNYSYVDYCPMYSLPCIFAAWQSKGFDSQGVYKGALPTSPTVLIRSNQYDSNRFHIAIMNWAQANNVPVDVRSILGVGDSYEVRDVQNFRGAPVLSGKYSGGDISVPMNLSTVDPYKGDFTGAYHTYAIGHTSSKFNTFILIRTASGGASPVPSIPPQQTQPTTPSPVVPQTPTIVPPTPATQPPVPVTQPASLTNPLTNPLNKTTNTVPPTTKQPSSFSNTKLPTTSATKTSSSSITTTHPDLPIPADLEPLPKFREMTVLEYISQLVKYIWHVLVRGVQVVFHLNRAQ